MILELLAYISVGLIVFGWLLMFIMDTRKDFRAKKEAKRKLASTLGEE
ncbi:MAG: hypothetical protein JXA54_02415 [Candidatus Heimdallarchaeota archaeon]|nr:hypothetical protein [Candidatus Heimdallarchaeota archaeon]